MSVKEVPKAGSNLTAHKLQRKQRLEALVQQRISNFNYLRKTHEGGHFWLNIVLLNVNDINSLVSSVVPKQRVILYYYLGLSIYSLLDIKGGTATVRALSQLIEEFEYFCSGTAMQGMKLLLAKNSSCVYPMLMAASDITDDALNRPTIYKFQNSIVYERLKTPHLAFELDYVEVLVALCDALSKIYEKIFSAECYSNAVVYESVIRLDGRIKHHFINTVSKELTDFCTKSVKEETNSIRNLLGRV